MMDYTTFLEKKTQLGSNAGFDEQITEPEPYLYQCQACDHLCSADECQCLGATGSMLICPECGGDSEIKSWEELTEYQI